LITSPVFIIGCSRSGTTLLYRLLSEARPLWSIGGESRHIIERFHHPSAKGWESGALSEEDLTPESRSYIPQAFAREAAPWTFWARVNALRSWLDRRASWRGLKAARASKSGPLEWRGRGFRSGMAAVRWAARLSQRRKSSGAGAKRLLEKTPENCLRLRFLFELFPDARFIHLVRDGRHNVGSLMEGWLRPDLFRGYRIPTRLTIPGVRPDRWAFTLIPGWRDLAAAGLAEICARQWVVCNESVLDFRDREGLHAPMLAIRFEDLIERPREAVGRIAEFAEVDLRTDLQRLPEANIGSAPVADKWHGHADAIASVEPIIGPTMTRLGYSNS
jgi:hypothetical protein